MRTPALVGCGLALVLSALTGCTSERGQERSGASEGALTPASQKEVKLPVEDSAAAAPNTDEPVTHRAKVKIIDTDFRPVTLTIEAGATVEWKQIGDQPHSVTAADGSFDSSPDCGPLDSDMCLREGAKFTHVFERPGDFTYYCRVHGLPDGTGMVGTIVVR